MRETVLNMWSDESGVVVSVELLLIVSIGALGLLVGLTEIAVSVNSELNDISNAVGALNQSYVIAGFRSNSTLHTGKVKSAYHGSIFVDTIDDCDNNQIAIVGASAPSTSVVGQYVSQ